MTTTLKKQSEKYLSGIRLFRYFEIDPVNYLNVYILNMTVSEKILSMISIFEIIFRNKVHSVLIDKLSADYLFDKNLEIFNTLETNKIREVRKSSNRSKISIKESKMLSSLTLGFWCGLVKNHTLWCKYLNKIFPKQFRRTNSIKSIIEKINIILKTRNMIAHHERIIKKPGLSINKILEVIPTLTLLLIDEKDKEFSDFVASYFNRKIQEINKLLDYKQG